MKCPRVAREICRYGNVLLPAIVLLQMAGCGEVYYKAEYDDATLTGLASGTYDVIITGEQLAQVKAQHRDVADVYIRFDDGAVFKLSDMPETEAKSRAASVDSDTQPGLTLYFAPSRSTLHFRNGKLTGAVLAEDIDIGSSEQGPFFRLPLSQKDMTDLMGEPNRETTFRGQMRWN